MSKVLRVCGGLAVISTAQGMYAQQPAETQVKALVQRFFAAEKAYDAGALTKLIDPDYVEISPAGEVDAHDRFLGFYTPGKKIAWPPMVISEEQVRTFGDTAIETLKTTYTMPDGKGGTRNLDIRGTFVAQQKDGMWRLIGAQYTGIRPVPPPTTGK
ncbi:nuclear transport factor 2 family protein [Terriglobus sp.]|uniref:nuclear transport factor 2 family protein n=1 Tax=Terriglobus sp. TaxID=1889013 RepID=UPI003B0032B4